MGNLHRQIMDKNDFRDEIKKYIDNTYSEFCEYQRIALDVLVEFDRICTINQLDYYLAYGSLIGAVRDHTQIPWDYDIDTLVKITDREKLVKVLNEDLGDDFYYDYSNKNSTYPTSCLRICKKGYNMMALHVDVFFLIGTPNEEAKRNAFIEKINRIMKLRTSKYLPLYLKRAPISRLGKMRQFLYKLIPNGYIKWRENSLFNKYSLKGSLFWCSNQTVYKKVYSNEIFSSVTKVNVNNMLFSAPIGFDAFLTIIYGNWQSYLPVKHRFEEFYKMKNEVDERQKLYTKPNRE